MTTVPVDLVLGVGPLGAMSARLFAWLTGSPLRLLEPDHASVSDIVDACAGKGTVLLCCDTRGSPLGLLEISHALGAEQVEFGFVYAFDVGSAIIAAFKAAFELEPDTGTGTYVLGGRTGPELDQTFGDLHVACGEFVEPKRIRKCLSAPSRDKIIMSHGNGFDFDLGRSVLCCIDGPIPKVDDPHLFPCFQTGACIRKGQERIAVGSIRADLLLMATCWGVFDGADEIDYARTAYAPLAISPNTWSLITVVRQWSAGPRDWLRVLGALSVSRTLGESVRRLNARFDPLHTAFVLFGNPAVRLSMSAEFAQGALELDGPAQHLPSGFRTLRIAPVLHEGGNLIVCGDDYGSSEGAELLVDCHSSEERLLTFCPSPLSIGLVPWPGPAFDPLVYQRLSRGAVVAARLIRDIGGNEDAGLISRIEEARRVSTYLVRALDGRRVGAGYVLLPREHLAATLVDHLWRTTTRDIVQAWAQWATSSSRPRFWFEIWRRDFALASACMGATCSSCGKRTRSETYACLTEPFPDRVLTFCRICSTRSDMLRENATTVAVRSIIDRDSSLEVCFLIENQSAHLELAVFTVFIMSATEVWPGSVSPPDIAWIGPGRIVEQMFAVPKPRDYIPGSHWLVFVGLISGNPITHCERVILRRLIRPGEHVWRDAASGRASSPDESLGIRTDQLVVGALCDEHPIDPGLSGVADTARRRSR